MANELVVPNKTGLVAPTALADPQARWSSTVVTDLALGSSGTNVLRGCVVTSNGTADKKVVVSAGDVAVGGQWVACPGATITLSDADGTNPRIDVVSVNASGTVGTVGGSAAADPFEPPIAANTVKLAAIYVPSGGGSTYTVLSTWIYSRRIESPDLIDCEPRNRLAAHFSLT